MNDEDVTAVERVNVALATQAADALKALQERTSLKKVDLVNRALTIYEFIDAELRAGRQIVLRDPQGQDQLVKFVF